MPTNFANPDAKIKHVFVLMLENRSFDHMLGFSKMTGIDAQTGTQTAINGLDKSYSNRYLGKDYPVTKPADWSMPYGPGHELEDVLYQLSGNTVKFPLEKGYPAIDLSGFVWDYVKSPSAGEGKAEVNYGEVLKCYDTQVQLPVLYTLATEFAVCDNWFSSLPGPTWPNRFFVHGATSHGLDDSPTTEQMAEWEIVKGFQFDNGSIFEALAKKGLQAPWRIYGGKSEPLLGSIPCVAALHHITELDYNHFEKFADDIQHDYPYFYTFIEPNYGDVSNNSYFGGQSQHPRDDVRYGEQLIKDVYETIRNSPLWENSLLIITYDEHGGFYDHVVPPKTVSPGDKDKYNLHGFDFEQLGVRVPAVVISPFIPKNIIDHTLYDHASIPATWEALTDLPPLTNRDAAANNLTALLSLSAPRADTPTILPVPASDDAADANIAPAPVIDPKKSIAAGNLPAFLFTAAKLDASMSNLSNTKPVFANSRAIQTHGDAGDYLGTVASKLAKLKKS